MIGAHGGAPLLVQQLQSARVVCGNLQTAQRIQDLSARWVHCSSTERRKLGLMPASGREGRIQVVVDRDAALGCLCCTDSWSSCRFTLRDLKHKHRCLYNIHVNII